MKSARFAAEIEILVFLQVQKGQPLNVASRQAASPQCSDKADSSCNAYAVRDLRLPCHDNRNRDREESVAGAIETDF